MKAVMTAVLVMATMVALCGCESVRESVDDLHPSIWAMGADSANDFGLRVGLGTPADQNDLKVEFGWEGSWESYGTGEHTEMSNAVYTIIESPWDVSVAGFPYVGFKVDGTFNNKNRGAYGPIVGTRRPLSKNISLVAEVGYQEFTGEDQPRESSDQLSGFAGIKGRF